MSAHECGALPPMALHRGALLDAGHTGADDDDAREDEDDYRFWPTEPAYIGYRGDVQPIRNVRIARASRDWSRFAPCERLA